MAGSALFRRGLVEQNGLRAYGLRRFMTLNAADILVRSPQCERRALLVIE